MRLAALGVALGLAASLAILRLAPRAPPLKVATEASRELAGSVLVEDEGAIDELVLHYTQGQEPVVATAYTDFLRALDPSTRIVAVVARAPDAGRSDEGALRAFLARVDPSGKLGDRVRIVVTDGPITVWSKDRALVLAPARAAGSTTRTPRAELAIPVRPDPRWRERYDDWATLASIARDMPADFVVTELPLEYDAGDFAVTGDTIVVDANLLAKNQKRGLATPQALSDFLRATFNRKVVFLGARDGDVPRHHLSMYMTPIGGGRVLVGDPRAGRALVGEGWRPGEESPDTGEALAADFSDATLARFDRAASDLSAAGFDVTRVPVVPFDDKTYVTYTNGVYETRGGRKIAYLPQYARGAGDETVAKMDARAAETYRRLGWEVRPIRVRDAYRFHGTIGCLCNVLRRSVGP